MDDAHKTKPQKNIEKNEKSFKKGIDKRIWMWYNIKVAARAATTVIENWTTREKYKAIKNSMCIGSRTILKQENTTQTKSKIAKSKSSMNKIESA